jgi:hypothetical protein
MQPGDAQKPNGSSFLLGFSRFCKTGFHDQIPTNAILTNLASQPSLLQSPQKPVLPDMMLCSQLAPKKIAFFEAILPTFQAYFALLRR